MTRGLLRFLGLLLVILGGAACRNPGADGPEPFAAPSSSAEPTFLSAEPRVHPVGELGRTPHFSLSADSTRECPLAPPFAPKAGFDKLGVELTLRGETDVEVPANPFYATLTDAAGTAFAPTLAGCEPALPAVRVNRGRTATGFVTFEVPKTAVAFELRYAPAIIGAKEEELRFAIRR